MFPVFLILLVSAFTQASGVINVCEEDTLEKVSETCMCGSESCRSFCYNGSCENKAKVCVGKAFEKVDEPCMCHTKPCSEYCFNGLCEKLPREKCTKDMQHLTVVKNWPGKANKFGAEGQYFGFKHSNGQTFYGNEDYATRKEFLITSRGYRAFVVVWRAAEKCDLCGRYDPKHKSSEGDWEMGDLLCWPMRDYGKYGVVQHPDAPPHSLLQCKQSLQVTDDHPGNFNARGMYFGFHEECVDAWYGNSHWHRKKINVTVEHGPSGTIRLFKYNDNCQKACGRWSPEKSIQAGDWRISDMIVKKSCNEGPISKHGACDCIGDPCTEGHWCYGGQCFKNPPTCGQGQVEEENCLCGDNVCFEDEYCKKGHCTDKQRICAYTIKPKRALNIKPVIANSDAPGLYFEFDITEATKFFNKKRPRWNYTGIYTLTNSCGETKQMYIMHNSVGCDKTNKKLQCGRFHPYSNSNTGDWNYDIRDKKASRWIAFPEDVKFDTAHAVDEDVEVADVEGPQFAEPVVLNLNSDDVSLPDDLYRLEAILTRPNGKQLPVKVQMAHDGSMTIEFTPEEAGNHFVAIKKDRRPVRESPFQVIVEVEDIKVGDIQDGISSINIMGAGACALAFFGGIYWGQKRKKYQQTYSSPRL